MNIADLNIRETGKKAIQKVSKNADKYDFVVKTGIRQDDLGFMSILDVPLGDPGSNDKVTLGEVLSYLLDVDTELVILDKELD